MTLGIAEMRSRGDWLFRGCCDLIHDHLDEGTLGCSLNTLEALLAEPEVAKPIGWGSGRRVVHECGAWTSA